MDIIFRKKYVNYNQFDDTNLVDINDVLIKDDISLELGDNFYNDWAGFSYYYCKSMDDFDKPTISSFIYVITWIMTGNPVDIYSEFKSNYYYKNSEIIDHCLDIYSHLIDKHNFSSEVDLCEELFLNIYRFYENFHELYIKRTERFNCLLTYTDLEIFNSIDCENCASQGDKLKYLLEIYLEMIQKDEHYS